MANTKEIKVSGTIPFTCTENDEFALMLGRLNQPTLGVRWIWTGEAGMVPNEHGGKTLMYNFMWIGKEAMSWAFIENVIKAIKSAGGKLE